MKLVCVRCGETLFRLGALLLSPPRDEGATVWKLHLCVDCYGAVLSEIEVKRAQIDTMVHAVDVIERG